MGGVIMKKFLLRQKGIEKAIGKFDSKIEAIVVMDGYITDNNDELYSDDEGFLTPFDFTLDEIEEREINECVTNYKEARKYLGGKPNADFSITKRLQSDNLLDLSGVARLVDEMNPRHLKALSALNKLFTIAEAWNKADDFVPDFSNQNQYKYYPWFVYDKDAAGFVYADTNNTAAYASANLGSRLCFKTANRARQFGEMFIDLYNEVFLFNDDSNNKQR